MGRSGTYWDYDIPCNVPLAISLFDGTVCCVWDACCIDYGTLELFPLGGIALAGRVCYSNLEVQYNLFQKCMQVGFISCVGRESEDKEERNAFICAQVRKVS
jgi:hypothetical protein